MILKLPQPMKNSCKNQWKHSKHNDHFCENKRKKQGGEWLGSVYPSNLPLLHYLPKVFLFELNLPENWQRRPPLRSTPTAPPSKGFYFFNEFFPKTGSAVHSYNVLILSTFLKCSKSIRFTANSKTLFFHIFSQRSDHNTVASIKIDVEKQLLLTFSWFGRLKVNFFAQVCRLKSSSESYHVMKRTLSDFAIKKRGMSKVATFCNLEPRLKQSCTYLVVLRLKSMSPYSLLCA